MTRDGSSPSKTKSQPKPPAVQVVSDLDLAFPSSVIGRLLPEWKDIPKEYKHPTDEWARWAQTLFSDGAKGIRFYPRPGIDAGKAYRMVAACLRSFQPKHEHKIAGVAYLLATFFHRIERETISG